jgi:hypothetical protein
MRRENRVRKTYQALHGQHLLCHASGRDITLHLKLFMIHQIHYGFEGVALQVPSELG